MLPYKLAVRPSQPIEQSQKSCKLKVKVIFIVLMVLFVNSEIVIPLGFSMMKFILIDSCSLMIMITLYKGLKKYKGFYDKDHIIYLIKSTFSFSNRCPEFLKFLNVLNYPLCNLNPKNYHLNFICIYMNLLIRIQSLANIL